MIENKFFNNSITTSSGKPKFMPPQKRQELHVEDIPSKAQQPVKEISSSEKENIDISQKFNRFTISEEKRPNMFFYKRNCTNLLTPWGTRHLRNGYLEKGEEEEEKKLFGDSKGYLNVIQNENVANYDDLKVDVVSKTDKPIPETKEKFEDLNLSPYLLNNIARIGYQKLTIIQRHAIPIIQNRINLMAGSQTGSGKTASFLLPIIQDMIQTGLPEQDISSDAYRKNRRAFPIALILAPTRELALQIYTESKKFCYLTGICTKVIYGGKDSYEQQKYLTWDGCDILVATPGRLIDFMDKYVDFRFVQFIVLDEADRMLDMGFEPQIREIMAKSFEQNIARESIHISMFSATFPRQVKNLAEEYLKNYVYIAIGNQGKSGSVNMCIAQELIDVRNRNKNQILFDLIGKLEGKLLVFCGTKRGVSGIYNYLNARNLFVSQIHGDLNQKERETELELFKNKCSIMIATDVASRGLDIPDVAYVINYDLPTNVEGYIHRIGRTGRIGKAGTAISFIDFEDEPMYYKLYHVLRDSKHEIPVWFQELVGERADYSDKNLYQNKGNGNRYYDKKTRSEGKRFSGFRGNYVGRNGYGENDENFGYG